MKPALAGWLDYGMAGVHLLWLLSVAVASANPRHIISERQRSPRRTSKTCQRTCRCLGPLADASNDAVEDETSQTERGVKSRRNLAKKRSEARKFLVVSRCAVGDPLRMSNGVWFLLCWFYWEVFSGTSFLGEGRCWMLNSSWSFLHPASHRVWNLEKRILGWRESGWKSSAWLRRGALIAYRWDVVVCGSLCLEWFG